VLYNNLSLKLLFEEFDSSKKFYNVDFKKLEILRHKYTTMTGSVIGEEYTTIRTIPIDDFKKFYQELEEN